MSKSYMDDDTLARLISMPNVIVNGHQAFLTKEALENIDKIYIMIYTMKKQCEGALI